ncbi:hypothetical protein N0V83_002520 [Neocucurbitaria cava]|uniref:BZIP transcription factor n=1 Tax=Neocucurbitaria cava TaxID=798079 RepID=A0A9W8YC85_9PLEO|nr:hypothetical protein N0V83_002520 [Neocucurbitaria cava]
MVNRRASDAGALPQTPIAPVVKRKRRASCLGEQERRERKRAIDREAQRSLREKTKTHIAELERTIQILRDQDRNGATANLLSEIDVLRAENERLRDVIDSVKSVVGSDLFSRNTAPATSVNGGGGGNSPAASSVGQRSPKPRAVSFTNETKPPLPTSIDIPAPFSFHERQPVSTRPLDLDGMTVMTDVDHSAVPDLNLGLNLDLEPVVESPEEDEVEDLTWGNDPATASWGPMMAEIFGPNWRCPSPVVLHIGQPDSSPSSSNVVCPVWKKSNDIFSKVFSYRSSTTTTGNHSLTLLHRSDHAEAGLLYLGIKEGWASLSNEWMQSPALTILKQVDELLFCHLPNVQRLAAGYKSFKLLKYYLNATKEELDKVPEWLRPSISQSSIKHPVAVDFFAWPTLRDRLVANHRSLFQNGDLSTCYSQYLRFDWPFSFEDAFFNDEITGTYYPSPLFERYHRDLRNWTFDPKFYERFPEMMEDIEGDRRRFSEVEVA